MPFNKLPRLREPETRDFVHEVKDLFMEQYKKQPELYYEEDVKLVENLDFILQRCLISKRKNVKDSFIMLDNMLKWRKEQGIRELTDQDFPVEYFTTGTAFLYEPDKYGNRTLYIRTRLLRAVPELKASLKQFIAYLMYQIDDCVKGQSFAVVFDLTDTGWNNYDIDLLMYFLTLLQEYFPMNVDYVLAINFPWILTAAWTLAKRLIPPERRDVVVHIPSDQVFKFIDKENVPDFLGGECTTDYRQAPKTSLTIVDYLLSQDDPKLSAKRIREIIKTVGSVLPQEFPLQMLKQLENSRLQ